MLCRHPRVKTLTGYRFPGQDKRQTLTFCGVILSGVAASLREAAAQSKDPLWSQPARFSCIILKAAETPNIQAACRL
jgi:hypothetical protein